MSRGLSWLLLGHSGSAECTYALQLRTYTGLHYNGAIHSAGVDVGHKRNPGPDRLRELRIDQGWSAHQIAEAYGVRLGTVHAWLNRADIYPPTKNPGQEHLQQLLAEGKTRIEMAALFGVNRHTIGRWLTEPGPVAVQDAKRPLREDLEQMRERGMSVESIARELRVGTPRVSSWLSEYGLPLRLPSGHGRRRPDSETLVRLFVNDGLTTAEIAALYCVGPKSVWKWLSGLELLTFARNCPHCGLAFTPENPKRVYCSLECVTQARRLRQREWQEENPDAARELRRRSYVRRRRAVIGASVRYRRERYRTDQTWRVWDAVRSRVGLLMRGAKNARTHELLGYDRQALRAAIESKLQPGMDWSNYGTEWHIDHIVPLAAFEVGPDFRITDDAVRVAFMLDNLRPLPSAANLSKGRRLPGLEEIPPSVLSAISEHDLKVRGITIP